MNEGKTRPMIAYQASEDLIARADAAAKAEGITRSDIARRALMRDLERRAQPLTETAA